MVALALLLLETGLLAVGSDPPTPLNSMHACIRIFIHAYMQQTHTSVHPANAHMHALTHT